MTDTTPAKTCPAGAGRAGRAPASVRAMLDYSNGNSFATGREPRHPVPPWKLGLRQSDDRGSI